MARPSVYNEDLIADLLSRIVEGESLRTICKDESMPAMSTIFKWLAENDEFSEQYTRAKLEQADTNAEDIQQLAKDVVAKKVDPHAARVAIDAYKWTASKLKPKKYGEKLDLEHSGEIITKYKDLDDAELDRLIKSRKDTAA